MKKNIIFVAIAAIAVAMTMIFVGCEKKEGNKDIVSSVSSNDAEFYYNHENYDAYIENLMAETGIDIYKVSNLTGIQKVADNQLRLMNTFFEVATMREKGTFTEDKISQIINLAELIQTKCDAGEEEEMLILFEQLCAICGTIDGFVFNTDEYGLQSFTYDPAKPPLQLPIAQMEAERANAVALIKDIETENPTFITLTEDAKINVVAAAISINMQGNQLKYMYTGGGNTDLDNCLQSAKNWRAIEHGVAAGMLTFGLAGCVASWAGYPLCAIGVKATYAWGVAMIEKSYNTSIENCNLKYNK